MNILLTGGAGFIGRAVAKRLLADGHKVWILDDLSNGREENIEEVQEYQEKKVEYYEIKNPARELTEIEKVMLRKPGEFSGDYYDEQKVNEKLEKRLIRKTVNSST